MPVNGCCALTQALSVSLHSNRGKPVIQRNFHCVLSIRLRASPSCRRSWPATSAAASVPLICGFAHTATTRSPVLASQAFASFATFSATDQFFDRRSCAFGGDFDEVRASRACGLGFFG